MYGCWVCATSLWILRCIVINQVSWQCMLVVLVLCVVQKPQIIIATHSEKIREVETSFCKPLPNGAVQKLNTRWGLISLVPRPSRPSVCHLQGEGLVKPSHVVCKRRTLGREGLGTRLRFNKKPGCHKVCLPRWQSHKVVTPVQGWWVKSTRLSQDCSPRWQSQKVVTGLVI